MKISPNAFADDKALSMRTIRHEMLHVRHRQLTLAAATKWDADGRKKPFGAWVAKHAKQLKLSAADVILVQRGAQGGQVDTEVLSYVEGFMTEFHLSPPTKAGTLMAFVELLGAASTSKYPTMWLQAHDTVKDEALARLRDYYATLGSAHRRLWKEWVDEGVDKYRRRHDGTQGVLRRAGDVRDVTGGRSVPQPSRSRRDHDRSTYTA